VFGCKEPTGPPAARLNLIGDEEDAVGATDLLEAREEVRGRNDEPAFPLHRLDDHRGHGGGVYHRQKGALQRLERRLPGIIAVRAPIRVRKRHPVDLRGERPEPRLVRGEAAGKAHGHERPPVEGVLEADDGGPARGGLGDLHRVLHRFRPGVEEHGLSLPAAGEGHQALRKLDPRLIGHDGEVRVREPLGLALHRLHNLGMGVADDKTPQPAREVEERIPVDIGKGGASTLGDEHRHVEVDRIRDHPGFALPQGFRLRARDLRDEVDGAHARSPLVVL
jgi:hypothetical protein